MEIYTYIDIYTHVKSESNRVVTYLFYLVGAYTDDGTWMGGWMNGRVDRLMNISHTYGILTTLLAASNPSGLKYVEYSACFNQDPASSIYLSMNPSNPSIRLWNYIYTSMNHIYI